MFKVKCLSFLINLSYSINKVFNLWFIVDLIFFPNFNFINNVIFIYLKFYFMHNNNKINYLNVPKSSWIHMWKVYYMDSQFKI